MLEYKTWAWPHHPYVPQIPGKWQEQKHNNVLSNHTNDHTEPFNRKKDISENSDH